MAKTKRRCRKLATETFPEHQANYCLNGVIDKKGYITFGTAHYKKFVKKVVTRKNRNEGKQEIRQALNELNKEAYLDYVDAIEARDAELDEAIINAESGYCGYSDPDDLDFNEYVIAKEVA